MPSAESLTNAASVPAGTWEPLGPAPMGASSDLSQNIFYDGGGYFGGWNAGRVDALAVIPSGPLAGRLVAGTAGGGVWTLDQFTAHASAGWAPRSDQALSLVIGAVAVDPSNSSHLIAGMGEAYQNSDGYYGFGVLSSTDGGTTWSVQDPGNVFDGQGIAEVAIDPANASHMFAATTGGLFVTSDGGASWTNINGTAFGNASGNNPLHPDQHAIAFAPDGTIFIGKDGGVYRYTGGQIINQNLGLDITQFYFGVSEFGYQCIMAGAQDNSTALGYGTPGLIGPTICCPPPALPLRWEWGEVTTGDGGPTAQATPGGPVLIESDQHLYISPPNGDVNSFHEITPFAPKGNNAPFTPPMIAVPSADPANPTVFYGAVDLWRTTNPSGSPAAWTKVTSVGTIVSAIAAAPSNPSVIYVGFKDGIVEVSTDGGASFAPLAAQPIKETFITGLSVDPTDPRRITASVSYGVTRAMNSGLDQPHVAQYSYLTSPNTGTWTVISGNLPANYGVSRVIYDKGALVAATDGGVYATGKPAGKPAWPRSARCWSPRPVLAWVTDGGAVDVSRRLC